MDDRLKISTTYLFICMGVLIPILLLLCIFIGSVHIPAKNIVETLLGNSSGKETWDYIIVYSRLPQALTALLAGAGLSVCGLMMQTLFHNPLADPSILGISSGANLGAAIVLLLFGGIISFEQFSIGGQLSVISGAFLGAMSILALIIWFSTKIQSNVLLLIIGVMIGYLSSSAISILNAISTQQGVHSFVLWGFGDFSSVGMSKMMIYSLPIIGCILFAMSQTKSLNAFLLGEAYAENLGVHILTKRITLLLCTGFLTTIITAFCGPIAFIGLAVPHIARMITKTSNHNILMPMCVLVGANMALLCNFISVVFAGGGIPLNAITSIMGIPVILYVLLNQKQLRLQ